MCLTWLQRSQKKVQVGVFFELVWIDFLLTVSNLFFSPSQSKNLFLLSLFLFLFFILMFFYSCLPDNSFVTFGFWFGESSRWAFDLCQCTQFRECVIYIKSPWLPACFLPLYRGLLPPRGSVWGCAGESQFLLLKTKTLPRWPGQLQRLWQLQPTKPGEKPCQTREAVSKPRRGGCRRGGSYIVSFFLPFVLWCVGSDSLYCEWSEGMHADFNTISVFHHIFILILSNLHLWFPPPPSLEYVVWCIF